MQAALKDGRLDSHRWENYLHMQKEIRFEKRKVDKAFQAEEKKKWAKIGMNLKRIKKQKGYL